MTRARFADRLKRLEAIAGKGRRQHYLFGFSDEQTLAQQAWLIAQGEAQPGDDFVHFITIYEDGPHGISDQTARAAARSGNPSAG